VSGGLCQAPPDSENQNQNAFCRQKNPSSGSTGCHKRLFSAACSAAEVSFDETLPQRLNRLLKKSVLESFVSGHDLGRAGKVLIFVITERASAREGSAVSTFSAACKTGDDKKRS
jgi:hypothetical protein